MPNLLDIRRRIRTVKNTEQITQAMKMVSAAKLRRAQDQALAARPYAERIERLTADVASGIAPQEMAGVLAGGVDLGELLARRPLRRRLVIAVTSDKGLAGAFNANVVKAVLTLADEPPGIPLQLETAGRKGRDFFRRHGYDVGGDFSAAFGRGVDLEVVRRLTHVVMERYAAGAVDEVLIVGNEFKSVLQQRVVVRRLLPVELPQRPPGSQPQDRIWETPPVRLLAALLPRYLETLTWRALLESFAAEHAARMNAMSSATENAGELIESLTLYMNRVRQAAITKEIIEVVSGAAALA